MNSISPLPGFKQDIVRQKWPLILVVLQHREGSAVGEWGYLKWSGPARYPDLNPLESPLDQLSHRVEARGFEPQ